MAASSGGSGSAGRSLSERFRAFLGLSTKPAPGPARVRFKELPAELVAGINGQQPVPNRVGSLHRLCELLDTMWVETAVGEKLWLAVRDLLQADQLPTTRQHCLLFLSKLLQALAAESTTIFRVHVFQVLRSHDTVQDDFIRLMDALDALTHDGTDVNGFENHIVPFLFELLPVSIQQGQSARVLRLCSEVFRLNPGLCASSQARELILSVCKACRDPTIRVDLGASLVLMGSIALSPVFPVKCLHAVLFSLCRMAVLPEFANTSLGVVENILNSNPNLLHLTVLTLCSFLEDTATVEGLEDLDSEPEWKRGVVFILAQAGWGDMKMTQRSTYPLTMVLACFAGVVPLSDAIVVCEMVISMFPLIQQRGAQLTSVQWEHITDIMLAMQALEIEQSMFVLDTVTAMLGVMEELFASGTFEGDGERLFRLVEQHPGSKDLAQALEYKRKSLHPSVEGWLQNVESLLDSYFVSTKEPSVKLKALSMLEDVFSATRHLYDSELITLLLSYMTDLLKQDPVVQKAALQLLAKLVSEYQAQAEQVFSFIQQTYDAVMVLPQDSETRHRSEYNVALALMRIFRTGLTSVNPSVCLRAFTLLINVMSEHLAKPEAFQSDVALETERCILELFVSIRWDGKGCVSVDTGKPSAFVVVSTTRPRRNSASGVDATPPLVAQNVLHLKLVFQCFLGFLTNPECNWKSTAIAVGGLPRMLRMAPVIVGQGDLCLDKLCKALYDFVDQASKTKNTPKGYFELDPKDRARLLADAYVALGAMTLYKHQLPRATSEIIVQCCTNTLRQNVTSAVWLLAICSVELEQSITRLLPSVLQTLQQFKTQKAVKLPLLEVLSLLGRRVDVIQSLNVADYKLVFAITLESAVMESNSAYIRALAFHVLALWFLRLPIRNRRSVVGYLIDSLVKGAPSSALDPLAESYIDFLTRYTFTNPSSRWSQTYSPGMHKDVLVGAKTRSWIMGYTIVTISGTPSGWAEVIVRRPTGTVSWLQRLAAPHRLMHRGGALDVANVLEASLKEEHLELPLEALAAELEIPVSVGTPEYDRSSIASKISSTGTTPPPAEGPAATRPIDIPSTGARQPSAAEDADPLADLPSLPVPNVRAKHPHLKPRRVSAEAISKFHPLAVPYSAEMPSSPQRAGREGAATATNSIGSVSDDEQAPETKEGLLAVRSTRTRALSTDSAQSYNGGDEDTDPNPSPEPESADEQDNSPALFVPVKKPAGAAKQPEILLASSESESSVSLPSSGSANVRGAATLAAAAAANNGSSLQTAAAAIAAAAAANALRSSGGVGTPHTTSLTTSPGSASGQARSATVVSVISSPPTAASAATTPATTPNITQGFSPAVAQTPTLPLSVKTTPSSGLGAGLAAAAAAAAAAAGSPSPATAGLPRRTSKTPEPDGPRKTVLTRVGFDTEEKPFRNRHGSLDSKARWQQRSRKGASLQKAPSFEHESGASAAPTPKSPRPRSYTVGVSTGHTPPQVDPSFLESKKQDAAALDDVARFVFLQLNAPPYFETKAIALETDSKSRPEMERAIKVLDAMAVFDIHKIGIVYVGPGQKAGKEILANTHGSARYSAFLRALGQYTQLRNNKQYCGGLDTENDTDGMFALTWSDAVTQVVFHVATLMPTLPDDPQCINKKLHIGNDHVTIVFNDSGLPFDRSAIAGAVNFVFIVMEPVDEEHINVVLDVKSGLETIVSRPDQQVFSNRQLGLHVRQLAIHANLASLVHRNTTRNWQDRLQQIKKIRDRFGAGAGAKPSGDKASGDKATKQSDKAAKQSDKAATPNEKTKPAEKQKPAESSTPWSFGAFM